MLQIPEVVQIAIGQDDEAHVLRSRVLAGLLLANQWIIFFGLGFQNRDGKPASVQKEIINEAVCGLFEIVAETFDALPVQFDVLSRGRHWRGPFHRQRTASSNGGGNR